MRVWLDGTECEMAGGSVAQAIERAASIAEARGRLIVEVEVDGESWSEDRIAEANEGPADEVRLRTTDPVAIVRSTWGDAADALRDADAHQRRAAELIQADRASDAMADLSDALSIWSSVQQAVTLGARAVSMDLDAQQIDGAPLIEHINRLNEQLSALQAALQSNDPVGLADTLLYDMPQTVADWRELLDHLREELSGEGRRP